MSTPPAPSPRIPPDLPADAGATFDPCMTAVRTARGAGGVDRTLATMAFGDRGPRGLSTLPVPGPAPDVTRHQPRPHRSPDAPTPARGVAAPAPPGAFTLRRLIGEGGFGEVWEAEQTSLRRTIAVKRLRNDPGTVGTAEFTDELRLAEVRFRQEAMTTAHLEHPNIVPVHELGHGEGGTPLLAMKRVKGHTWKTALAGDLPQLAPADFLSRHLPVLVSVARAVAFAHAHGIVHRDLKPAQVMTGPFGEVVLMDWGLAMACTPRDLPGRDPADAEAVAGPAPWMDDPDAPIHHPMNPAGTAAYMAPEQTDNDALRLGPWTDVFLLGGMLYELLTGTPPHQGVDSVSCFLAAEICEIEPAARRAEKREPPASLATLAAKAMAKRPEDRLAGAAEFLTALEDYLSGADRRAESRALTEEAVALRGASASTETDYAALAVSLERLDRALDLWPGNGLAAEQRSQALAAHARAALDHGDLRLARMQAERLAPGPKRDGLLNETSALEDRQRRANEILADALARAKADRDRAEGLVRYMLSDLHVALKSIGRLDIMRGVATQALAGTEPGGGPEPGDRDGAETTDQALHNRALAHLAMGDILSDEGRKPESQAAYAEALAVAAPLSSRDRSEPDRLLTLAAAHEGLGRQHYFQGRSDQAHVNHAKALEIRRRVGAAHPAHPGTAAAVASSVHQLGIIAWRRQELAGAMEMQTASLAGFREAAAADPNDLDAAAAVGWNLATLGNVHRDLGELERAIEVSRESLEIRLDLHRRQPANNARLEDVLWTRGNLALIMLLNGDMEEALALFETDIELRRRLADEDPDNVVRLGNLTFPLSMIGEIQFMLGNLPAARETARECLAVSRELAARDPASTWALAGGAIQACAAGEIETLMGRVEHARPLAEAAVADALAAVDAAPSNVTALQALARALVLDGRLARGAGDETAAHSRFDQAAEILPRLKLSGEQLGLMDLKVQLAYLSGGENAGATPETTALVKTLRARRWISPWLADIISGRANL